MFADMRRQPAAVAGVEAVAEMMPDKCKCKSSQPSQCQGHIKSSCVHWDVNKTEGLLMAFL